MARRLEYARIPEDDRLGEAEIDGKVYTFPLPNGLTTDQAQEILAVIERDGISDDNIVSFMRTLFDGALGADVVGKMPLGEFKSLAAAWIDTMREGVEGLGES